jgi:hypothetical protein
LFVFAAKFNPGINAACDDFIQLMMPSDGEVVFDDFLEELKKLFMEITGIFTLGIRLGGLDKGWRIQEV